MLKIKSILAKIFSMKSTEFILLLVFYVFFISFIYFIGRANGLEKEVDVLKHKVDSLNNELLINELDRYYIFDHSSIK